MFLCFFFPFLLPPDSKVCRVTIQQRWSDTTASSYTGGVGAKSRGLFLCSFPACQLLGVGVGTDIVFFTLVSEVYPELAKLQEKIYIIPNII